MEQSQSKSIFSQKIESMQDEFSGKFCSDCLHLVSEHDSDGKCRGLDTNGTVISACKCKKPNTKFTLRGSYDAKEISSG